MKSLDTIKKIIFATLLTFTFSFSTIVAQNDTMYVMKSGAIVGKYNVNNQVDSIIFYNPSIASVTALDSIIIDNNNSASLQESISELNDTGIVIIERPIMVNADIDIPSTIEIVVRGSGGFELDAVSLITINGKFSAGLHKIFNTRNIEFSIGSVSEVSSEWFGTNDLAVNYALLSAGAIPVVITNNINVSSAILLNSNQTLSFQEATIFTNSPMTGGAVIKNRNNPSENITVIGGLIDGSGCTSTLYDAILLTGVENALIQDVVCREVHITSSHDTGNFHLVDCIHSTIQDVEAHDTWKMGIMVEGGHHITINGGYFTGTHDSGIGGIDSPNMHVNGVFVDNCGTSNASNITINLQNGIFENSISINASGTTNGNGLTVGHEGYPAFQSIIRNNLFINNETKGLWSQGSTNYDISFLNNIVMDNGTRSEHPNSSGIAVYYGGSGTVIQGNEIIGNLRGISLAETSTNTTISDNRIINSSLYGIDNDGYYTTITNNQLSNDINIFNDTYHTNLTANNNIETSADPTYDLSYLGSISWLTDLQKDVLAGFTQ